MNSFAQTQAAAVPAEVAELVAATVAPAPAGSFFRSAFA